MTPQVFIDHLLEITQQEQRLNYLRSYGASFELEDREKVLNGLLNQVITLMGKDAMLSIEVADLMLAYAALTGEALHRAVGLRAKAQAIGNGQGAYQESIPLFEEAIEIHRQHQDDYGEALVCITYIWALAHVGRIQEALTRGAWAVKILREQDNRWKLSLMLNNLGLVQNRVGEYALAYETFSEATQVVRELGGDWSGLEYNVALVLFSLGEISKAEQSWRETLRLAQSHGTTTLYARSLHMLGLVLFFQGKYNDALQLNDQALELHQQLNQPHEVALCKLSKTDCLLELRQFKTVIKLCEELIPVFRESHNFTIELAEAIRNQASALVGIKRYAPAIEALQEARALFLQENHVLRGTYAHLQTAICYRQQKRVGESIEIALACAQIFDEHHLLMDASRARLLACWGYLAEKKFEQAAVLVDEIELASQTHPWAQVQYQILQVKGQLAFIQGENQNALAYLSLAVAELEKLRGNAMIEHRVNFVEDKQTVYGTLVQLLITQAEVEKGWEYVERAKSRTLIELMKTHAYAEFGNQTGEVPPLLDQLQTLRTTREEKLRHALSLLEASEPGKLPDVSALQQEVQKLEDQITEIWHQLLIRSQTGNASAASGEVKVDDIRRLLDSETLLVEYFVAGDQLLAFTLENTATRESVQVFSLSAKLSQVKRLLEHLNLNFSLVAGTSFPDEALHQQAQALLHRLYEMLVLPIEPVLTRFRKLIFVPFDILHAVPFHALYDSKHYLIENYLISYLPAASLLQHVTSNRPSTTGKLALGHSFQGRLPYALEEAQHVAELWEETALCEDQARVSTLRPQLATARLLHIACHGTYHDDNALFSGLMLGDGYLTTLDVFSLPLNASLVTLSACQTGVNKIGGGDELLGLARAFLSAGTISLVMTLWPVADQSTIQWMENFYTFLNEGKSKGEAIRLTQCKFLTDEALSRDYRHPFFWAPFFLIGDTEKL